MVHNIFPDRKDTILHYIARNVNGFDCIEYLFELSKKGQFVIPFLFDNEGLTPLDIAVNNNDHKQINAMLKMLSKSPMDHHSRMISHLIP
jgi:ankyrin repeat protein